MKIDSFSGEYRFLSNFWPCIIVYEDITYPSTEHYYVAMKTTNTTLRKEISLVPTAGKVKRFGREKIKLRPDWDDVRLQVMEFALRQKFSNTELKNKLLATGDSELIEGNNWHDVFFGICSCDKCGNTGQNYLGRLLMKIRSELIL